MKNSLPSHKGAIIASHLSFSYLNCSVLNDLSFTIEEGQFVGIIGPNGGGKTTLLYLLMGFLKPQKGTICISVDQSGGNNKPVIGFVPQYFQYDRQFPISVLEVVLMGRLSEAPHFGGYSKKDRAVAHRMLERVAMSNFASYLFSDLSGGQAQRVLIARALASQPQFLFLDEATANVDGATREVIYQLLKELKREMTILLVTHDLQTALAHVDCMLLVQSGASLLSKEAVCEHFALGLYHPPMALPRRST